MAHKMADKSKLQASRFRELLNPFWLGTYDLSRVIELIEHRAASGANSIEVFNLSGGVVKALRLEKFTVERVPLYGYDYALIAGNPETYNAGSVRWWIKW